MAEYVKVAETTGFEPGMVKHAEVGGTGIAVANVDGSYYAVESVCTHVGGPLAEGELHTYLVLSEWESPDAMRGWLRHPDHLEVLRHYKQRYQGGKVDRRRYAPLPPK